MACKREDRFRRNTIAFWLSDEEKSQVESKIILSGISKGEYYRKAVLGQAKTRREKSGCSGAESTEKDNTTGNAG